MDSDRAKNPRDESNWRNSCARLWSERILPKGCFLRYRGYLETQMGLDCHSAFLAAEITKPHQFLAAFRDKAQ
jgi:hypothetical protein